MGPQADVESWTSRSSPRAIEHGLSEDELLHAYRNPIRAWDLGPGLTMVIGANQAALALEAVRAARQAGMSWSGIGTFVGTTGEAACQRSLTKVA